MRVRNMAVVGVLAAVAWAGGAGLAQATPGATSGSSACPPPLTAVALSSTTTVPCGVDYDAAAEVGCIDDAVLSAWVEGLTPGSTVRVVVGGVPGDLATADDDGYAEPFTDFDPAATSVAYEIQLADGTVVGSGTEDVVSTCTGKASLKVTGDCKEPETLTFELSATELEANAEYGVLYVSDGFTVDPNRPIPQGLFDTFTTDDQGAGKVTTKVTEDAQVAFDSGKIDIVFLVGGQYAFTTTFAGVAELEPCAVDPAPQPGATAPPATTPVVAPVAVPVAAPAAHPAVLANTGSPVTSAALLGGGLVLAGAGAMVATRRRAS